MEHDGTCPMTPNGKYYAIPTSKALSQSPIYTTDGRDGTKLNSGGSWSPPNFGKS